MALERLGKAMAGGDAGQAGSLYSLLKNVGSDLVSQGKRIPDDIGILFSLAETELANGLTDDKKYLIERIIQLAASLPTGSGASNDLTETFIKTLWNNLRHPPISYLGDEFVYRTADGSNNNIMYPRLGAAGSSYARSVTPKTFSPHELPDPSTIFDALLARKGPAKEHPNKISTTLFNIATLIIHDVFRTNDIDPSKVDTSSYLDLAFLYGHNQEQQNSIRTFKNGTLKPDSFTEPRLLGQPPGVCALAIAFNRFHNYVVGELAKINENGRFSLPAGLKPTDKGYESAELKRDNDLFQTGRLITGGLWVNIILFDYVKTILNLNRSNTKWTLDPRTNFDTVFDPTGTPQGIGNQVSVEFNLIYRWHSTISNKEQLWAEDFYQQIFPNQDPSTLPLERFLAGLRAWAQGIDPDPGQRTFNDLKRKADGSFETADLVSLVQSSTEDVAGAYGARNVPTIMKAIEILGIQQGRKWKTATLNELRKFFKLKPYTTFLEISSDPAVAEALETLYGHPDFVELYPGVCVEDAKIPMIPGSGLCPGFTIATAILSDAVALVRGDRFYTVDYSPANLTNWGYNLVAADDNIAGGGVMYKLLMNAFPGYYRSNSVYAMFPFTVPDENRKILRTLGKEKDYDFSKPSLIARPIPVLTWDGVVSVLKDQVNYKVPWGPHTFYLTGHDYMLSGDSPANAEQKVFVKNAVYSPPHGLEEIGRFYEEITTKLIHEKSRSLGGFIQLDVVRDIANLSHANYIAHMFHIPIQSAGGGPESYTETSLYNALANLFAYVFLDYDTTTSFALRATALRETKALGNVVQDVVERVRTDGFAFVKEALGLSSSEQVLRDYGKHLIERLSEGGKSIDEVVWTIIPTAAAAVATQAQGLAQVLDLYLSDEYKSYWPAIQELAKSDSPEAFEKLKKYALEGLRLAPPAFGLVRVVSAETATIHDSQRTISVKKGDSIYVDFITAGKDPQKFPNPDAVNLDRPDADYIHHGWGAHACLGRPIVTVVLATQLKVFAKLTNLRRSPGADGDIKFKLVNGDIKAFLNENATEWAKFPTNKKVHFDGFGS
ncbi:hypothetical protein MMC07_009643 [Pseudocyphellaria aurata]|nr:hypothetical protein [Pseudocyphellaria aurata]